MTTSVTSRVVGVIGAGAMGRGIAQVAAAAGHRVVLGDARAGSVRGAVEAVGESLEREVARGRASRDGADGVLARITDAGPLEGGADAYAECDVLIEAIVEDLGAKRALFTSLERVVRPDAVLATNTSSLSIAGIAAGCTHPERVVGIHFFNPAPVMPLVELVPAIGTAPDVLNAARALIDGWGKTTVVASDTPGFIVNRIARPFYGEALRQLEEGMADIATIDWAMRELGGFRMGPFELMDFIGNDVNYAVTTSVFEAMFFDPRYRPSLVQRRLVEAGRNGRKSGRGYYDYRDGVAKPEPDRDLVRGQRIVDRIVAMLINEAVDAMHLDVASAADIELAMTRGVNYPRGLLEWGDLIGATEVLRRLDELQEEYREDRYRPSPLLRRRARAGLPLTHPVSRGAGAA